MPLETLLPGPLAPAGNSNFVVEQPVLCTLAGQLVLASTKAEALSKLRFALVLQKIANGQGLVSIFPAVNVQVQRSGAMCYTFQVNGPADAIAVLLYLTPAEYIYYLVAGVPVAVNLHNNNLQSPPVGPFGVVPLLNVPLAQ